VKIDVSVLKKQSVDLEAMTQELRKKPSEEGANKVQPNIIITELAEVLNDFCIKINKFTYLKDLKGTIELTGSLTKSLENIQKIKTIIEEK
jgi:hypothetical protein